MPSPVLNPAEHLARTYLAHYELESVVIIIIKALGLRLGVLVQSSVGLCICRLCQRAHYCFCRISVGSALWHCGNIHAIRSGGKLGSLKQPCRSTVTLCDFAAHTPRKGKAAQQPCAGHDMSQRAGAGTLPLVMLQCTCAKDHLLVSDKLSEQQESRSV